MSFKKTMYRAANFIIWMIIVTIILIYSFIWGSFYISEETLNWFFMEGIAPIMIIFLVVFSFSIIFAHIDDMIDERIV